MMEIVEIITSLTPSTFAYFASFLRYHANKILFLANYYNIINRNQRHFSLLRQLKYRLGQIKGPSQQPALLTLKPFATLSTRFDKMNI
jgi:uncharacterized protein with ParB-like and HNH nuclease domain